MECVCHVATTSETVLRLSTQDRKKKLVEFAEKWAQLDKQPELDIALQILSNNELITVDSVYHHACFLRFASATHLERAARSKRKRVS